MSGVNNGHNARLRIGDQCTLLYSAGLGLAGTAAVAAAAAGQNHAQCCQNDEGSELRALHLPEYCSNGWSHLPGNVIIAEPFRPLTQ